MQLRIFHIVIALAFCIAAVQNGFCRTNRDLSERIGDIAEAHAANDNFSGAVLLAKNGKIIFEKSYGFADRATKAAFTGDTASNVCSVGKVFTAVLVLQLVEEGRLSLADTVAKHLPSTRIPNADRITIRHLLMHTSGLGDLFNHPDFAKLPKDKAEAGAIIPLVEDQPLRFDEPGTRSEYSNSGYAVLGKIVEQAAGKRYAAALEERIIRRLGLKNTRFEIERERPAGLAKGYQKRPGTDDWRMVEASPATAAAGIFSSPKDLFRFGRALFGGELLKRETVEKMSQRLIEMPVRGNQIGWDKLSYGYGMMIRDYSNGAYSVGHDGWMPGYNAEFQRYTVGKDEYTLIITSNYELRTRPLLLKIQNEIINHPETKAD